MPMANSAKRRQEAIAKRLKDASQPRKPYKPRCNPRPFKAKPKPEGYTFGRPTEYKPEYCGMAVEIMGKGYSLTALAGFIGVSRETVYQWQDAHIDFRDAVTKGKAGRVAALETKLLTTSMGVGVTAAIFALKNAEPDNWQDRFNTQTDINVRITQLSDAQLLEIAARAKTIDAVALPQLQHSNQRQPVADDAS